MPVQQKVDGIPFILKDLWVSSEEGSALRINLPGLQADSVYLLGGCNTVDAPNPGYWGGGDSRQNFFIGDQAGCIKVVYRSGTVDTIPVVFGYNIWWGGAYRDAAEPFASDAKAYGLLGQALCVANGRDAFKPPAKPYFVKIALRREPLAAMVFEDNKEKAGHLRVEGITFENVEGGPQHDAAPFEPLAGGEVSPAMTQWLAAHTIDSAAPYPRARKKAVEAVAHRLYTYPEDISERVLAATPAQVTEANFPGPKVRFTGSALATLLTHIYYENSQELLGRVDADGTVHESHLKADYFRGPGTWTPGLSAFYGDAYTRLRMLTLLSNMGFSSPVNQAIAFFDHWLMYFPKSYPKLQLGGKPIPGHATVVANKPHVYFDVIIKNGGWRTRYKTHDFGNPENDGHGMLMLTRWRAWLKQGRTKAWVQARWEALNEAAEYIPWALDHPELSFSAHGLLYNETEGGMQQASLYCDLNCYLGLLGYAEMAEVAGHPAQAARWRQVAARMAQAMETYYPSRTAEWGEIWDPTKDTLWTPNHSTLSPVVIGMDYWGYDVAQRLPRSWAERTRRTYRRQLAQNKPEWCATMAGMGYGQGYITQAALLLDQMSDAGKMIEWMARFCYAPRTPHPYRVPEGANLATDGSVWRKWGDIGNLYQLGEVVYTIQVMLGIEDLNPRQVRLMPRLPLGWTGYQCDGWPVRTRSQGRSELISISIELRRDRAGNSFDMDLQSQQPIDDWAVRLGPFPRASRRVDVRVNGKAIAARLEQVGDSQWCWIHLGDRQSRHYKIRSVVTDKQAKTDRGL